MVASRMPQTGDLARSPGMSPSWGLNQEPLSSQANTQSTEPQQPGSAFVFKYDINCKFFIDAVYLAEEVLVKFLQVYLEFTSRMCA